MNFACACAERQSIAPPTYECRWVSRSSERGGSQKNESVDVESLQGKCASGKISNHKECATRSWVRDKRSRRRRRKCADQRSGIGIYYLSRRTVDATISEFDLKPNIESSAA